MENNVLDAGSGGRTITDAAGAGIATEVAATTARRLAGRRQPTYEDEVRRLLDAGLLVMHRSGRRSPTVAEIVREAGLSNDAFYRHFPDGKDALVAAILLDGAERLARLLERRMASSTDPGAQLRVWIEAVLAQAADPVVAAQTRAVLWNGARSSQGPGSVEERSVEVLSATLRAPLQALGSAAPAVDADLVGRVVIGRLQHFLASERAPAPADVDHLVSFCTRACSPAEASPDASPENPAQRRRRSS